MTGNETYRQELFDVKNATMIVMNDSLYLTNMIIILLAMLAIIVHVNRDTVIGSVQRVFFETVFAGIALGAVAEFFGVFLDSHPMPPVLHYIVTFLEFCVMPFLPGIMARACSLKKMSNVMLCAAVIHCVIEAIMLLFGGIYSIDLNGIYHRGRFYVIYIGFYITALCFLFAIFHIISKRFNNRDLGTIRCAAAVLFVGIIPAVIDSSIRSSFLAVAVASILLYIYYEGLTQQEMQSKIEERNKKISAIQDSTIHGMANLIESRNGETGVHVKNTAAYVKLLAYAALEKHLYPDILSENYADLCVKAAPLHDVGKIVVPDAVLNKPGKLTPEEFEIMKKHASEGERIVRSILDGATDTEYLQIAEQIAGLHHEKWDGSGYPNGLAGEDIPLCARIMALSDVYDALISERVYKKPMPKEQALEIIRRDTGTHFDPLLAPLFIEIIHRQN